MPLMRRGFDPEKEMAPRPITCQADLDAIKAEQTQEYYFLIVDVWNCQARLVLFHQGGEPYTVGDIPAPKDLLTEAIYRTPCGTINRSGWYPATPEIEAWVKDWANEEAPCKP